MAASSPEFKAGLERIGEYAEFEKFERGLIETGMDPKKAKLEAIKVYAEKAKAGKAVLVEEAREAKQAGRRAPVVCRDESESAGTALKADFAGKTADEVEAIRWVADNMEISDVTPSDCPSAAAWGLLMNCRRDTTAKTSFWNSLWPKILPARSQMGAEPDRDDYDGKLQVDTIERIRKMAEAKMEVVA